MEQDWGKELVDVTKASTARVYDAYLGGMHHFPADQRLAAQVIAANPWVTDITSQNRAFLRHAVSHMCAQGITQFLDLGAGLLTDGAVHEIAQGIEPTARVVYVDLDPVVVMYGRQLLGRNRLCAVVRADFARLDAILADPAAASLLDMSQPIGVLSLSTLHFVNDDTQVGRIVQTIYDHVAPGSLYALTHGSSDERPDQGHMAEQLYRASGTPLTLRTRAQLQRLIAPFKLTPPGLVPLHLWRPDAGLWPAQTGQAYGCVAVKPAHRPQQAAS